MNNWLYSISPCARIVGQAATEANWAEAARYIYDHELVLFDKTDFTVEIDEGDYKCPAGSFLIIPPGVRHTSYETKGKSGHRYWIHFDWFFKKNDNSTPVLTYCPATPKHELFRYAPKQIPTAIQHGQIRNFNAARERFHQIDHLFNFGDPVERLTSRAILLELLLILLSSEIKDLKLTGSPKQTPSHGLAGQIRRQLTQFAADPDNMTVSIQEFLKYSGISYAHQGRVFKKAYGVTPLQYVMELRMARIKKMLRDTNLNISEISSVAGFSNLGHFSSSFKKYVGISPLLYRKKYHNIKHYDA